LRELPKACDPFSTALAVAQWFFDHRHNAAITARYGNELEAESKQNLPDLENQFLHRSVALKWPIF
jgi:hypothetical protein